MYSLQYYRDYGLKALFAIIILSSLTVAAAAQNVAPQQQGRYYGDPMFVGEPINLNVVNADIRDILNYVTEQYGINFVIDKSVGKIPVTVNVNSVPWNVALDSILASQDLGIKVNGTILRVADKKTLAEEFEKDQRIQDSQIFAAPLVTQYVRLNYARAKDAIVRGTPTSGSFSQGASYESAAFAPQGAMQSSQQMGGQTSQNSGLLPIIQRRLSKRGSIEVDGRSNSLIITDVKENVDQVMQLIAILDQPEPQVEIEARIVVATRNFSRDIGVQLAALVTGPRGALGSGSTLPGTNNTTGLQPNGIPSGIGVQPNNSLLSSIPNTIIGLTTGIFGTAQLSALISAGEQKGQAKIIATPRVTTMNLQSAKIESKTQIPITTIQPGAASGGAIVATTQYVDVPLKLEITPQITDVGTIVLDVTAENSSTATIVGGAAPAINNQTMQTQVTVPDGGTTVVGGVLFDDERENQDRTPGLSRIPIFGNLFKRKGVTRNTNEILFFITPRIYRPEFDTTPGRSGVTTTGRISQPVPLGNPPSNSDQVPVAPQPVLQTGTTGPRTDSAPAKP
jgi:type IV pilus assembly protein PilQ